MFIVSSPRSGSSLLFVTIAKAAGIFTIGGESHALIESVPGLHPASRGWDSNRLTAIDATQTVAQGLSERFYRNLRDARGQPPAGTARMVEKTPKNSLRVPFLDAIHPDAAFVYLYRDPRATLSSMIEAWSSGRFVTYPRLPDWPAPAWSLLLTPGWRDLRGKPLIEIVARQWAATTDILLDDLDRIAPDRVTALSYQALIDRPQSTIASLCRSLGIRFDEHLGSRLPLSPTVVSAPAPDKWRQHEDALAGVWPIVAAADARAREALARFGA